MGGQDRPGGQHRGMISALGLVQLIGWGSTFFLLAVLSEPIAQDTGWPIGWIVGGLSMALLASGIAAPRVGDMIRHFGGRPMLITACITLASGLSTLALAPNIVVFLGGWVVIGLGMSMGLYDAAFATLGGVLGHGARRAITTVTLWGGFASTLSFPLSAALNDTVGWRWTFAAYAAMQIVVSLPLVLAFVPGNAAPRRAGAGTLPPLHLSSPERHAFRLIMTISTLSGTCFTILAVHLVVILQGRGLSLADAVVIGALIGPAQVVARFAEMVTGGRHHPFWTLAGAIGLMALGLGMLATGLPLIGMAIVLYAGGNGIFSIAKGSLPLVWFGPARYAAIMGRLARPSQIAQALAPMLGATLLALGGAGLTLLVLAVFALINVGLVVVLRRMLRAQHGLA